MSHDFRIYLSGDDFPLEAWQFVMGFVSSHPLPSKATDPWPWQWLTTSRVWVTVESLANTRIVRPPWAQWCVALDFHTGPLEERFDATTIVALALVVLPQHASGIRVQATDAFDDASADSVGEWATIAHRYLDQEAVASIVECVSSA